jgi:hypothetical protein
MMKAKIAFINFTVFVVSAIICFVIVILSFTNNETIEFLKHPSYLGVIPWAVMITSWIFGFILLQDKDYI